MKSRFLFWLKSFKLLHFWAVVVSLILLFFSRNYASFLLMFTPTAAALLMSHIDSRIENTVQDMDSEDFDNDTEIVGSFDKNALQNMRILRKIIELEREIVKMVPNELPSGQCEYIRYSNRVRLLKQKQLKLLKLII